MHRCSQGGADQAMGLRLYPHPTGFVYAVIELAVTYSWCIGVCVTTDKSRWLSSVCCYNLVVGHKKRLQAVYPCGVGHANMAV